VAARRSPFLVAGTASLARPGHRHRQADVGNGDAVIYLIAGVDRATLVQWHDNVMATDVTSATRIARARAASRGIELVVAAVIGPYSSIVTERAEERSAHQRAA
jgi:hypothetical protein